MRTNYSLRNSISAIISNCIALLIGFVAQSVFIKCLGTEYLGLNGLFTNILTMLSIFELGIGSAIVFNLYKPISENNYKLISALTSFYKKAYIIVAIFISIIGLCLIPFLKYIINDLTININIYVVYLLFLLNTIVSYFMAHKRSLIIAYQKNYIINFVHMIYIIFLNVLQLLIICYTKNFYLYLLVKVICQIMECIIINIIANRLYPYLKNAEEIIDQKTRRDILTRIKALFFHKIGAIIINGTDNILISTFIGISQVGLYTNYYTIINAVNIIFGQIISSNTASVGNLLVSNNTEKKYSVFNKMRFINFIISTFTSVSLLLLFKPFISLWIGQEYLLDSLVVIIIVFNFFQKMQRNTYSTFKDSAGIWREDKYVPIIESLLNIISSIFLLKIFGLPGVFLGTIISGLVLWCFSYPKFVYKKIFNRSYINYAMETIGYVILFLIIAIIAYMFSSIFNVHNLILQLFINSFICLIIPILIIIVIFRKTENFNYLITLIKKIFHK